MRASAVLAVVAACAAPPASTPPVVYDAPAAPADTPIVARLGIGAPRQAVVGAPIVGVVGAPLAMTAVVGSTGPGRVVAAVTGRDLDGPAIDLIDVDAGVVVWRNRSAALPAVAVYADRVIASGGEQVVVLDRITGVERTRHPVRWLRGAATRDGQPLAVVQIGERVAWYDATGVGAAMTVPAARYPADVVAVCDVDERFALAWRDGSLERWDLRSDAVQIAWAVPMPQPARAWCEAAPLVIVADGVARSVALDGTVGATAPAVDAWSDPLHPERIELATADAIEVRDRRLTRVERQIAVAVARIASGRGPRRLALTAAGEVAAIDDDRAALLAGPGGEPLLVAGDRAWLAGPWRFPRVSQDQRPTRYLWPAITAAPTLEPTAPPLVPDAPRVDVPAAGAVTGSVPVSGGAWAVGAVIVDPFDHERLFAVVLDERPTAATGAAVAAFDLHVGAWRWLEPRACPGGTPIAIAVAGPVVACAARGTTVGAGSVIAVDADRGHRVWRWDGRTVDAVVGGGDAFAILAGSEVIVVDAASGLLQARWRASDGFVGRVALARRGDDTRIASYEHGALVVRSRSRGWLPVAATAVDGAVTGVVTIGDRFAVTLADGSLYLVADDGTAVAAGAVWPGWQPRADRAVVAMRQGTDGAVFAVDARGVPRVAAAIPGRAIAQLGARASTAGAPLAIVTDAGELLHLSSAGAVVARADLGDPTIASFATIVDGVPVVGAVVPDPLRVLFLPAPP